MEESNGKKVVVEGVGFYRQKEKRRKGRGFVMG